MTARPLPWTELVRRTVRDTIDDDCLGGDAPGRLTATIKNKWTKSHGRLRVDDLRVLAPALLR